MTPALPNRRQILIATGAAMLWPQAARATPEAGVVEMAEGKAWAEPARPLSLAAPVFIGDRVATGAASRLELMLGGVTRILMGAETRLTIDRFTAEAGGELVLGQGALLFDRDEAAPKTPVALSTAFGLIAVRGTRFFAGPSKGVFGVFVARGEVRVTGGGAEVALSAGQGTDIAAPGARPTSPAPWADARIAAALASVGA